MADKGEKIIELFHNAEEHQTIRFKLEEFHLSSAFRLCPVQKWVEIVTEIFLFYVCYACATSTILQNLDTPPSIYGVSHPIRNLSEHVADSLMTQ